MVPDKDAAHTSLLAVVEKDLDASYYRLPLPHPNRAIATWYLLTVLEDLQRGLFVLSDDVQAATVELQLDRLKYSTRFALDRIRMECSDTSKVKLPSQVIPKIYLRTADLLHGGVDYMGASQLCSSAHAGTVLFQERDAVIEAVIDKRHHDKRYAALELLGHLPPGVVDHATLLYAWTRHDDIRPQVLGAIARSVRIVGRQVAYRYRPDLATALAAEMMQQPFLIPDDWRFSWGGRNETTLLINALCVRCVYHWVAVHFGASWHGLRGGGEASILLISSSEQLVHDIREMSSLPEVTIRGFIRHLTYGYEMKTPDPALQPLVSLGQGLIGVPCMLFLSSNHERNLLSLQARIESSAFNTMSKLFERDMVRDLLEEVKPHWALSMGNATVRVGGEFEEIDLLVADPSSRTLLVCELRWMLGPGDPREVQNRKKVCWEKVEQLQRKVQWLRPRAAIALENEFKICGASARDWQVHGIVVIKTFGGALSKRDEFPIMTARLFTLGIKKAVSLAQFASWSQSLCWLPQEGIHFQVLPREIELLVLGKRLISRGMEKLGTPWAYTDFVERTLKEDAS